MSIFAPTIEINPSDLENLIEFIFKYEEILKEFGAIKIQLNSQCQLALKTHQIPFMCSSTQIITKINKDQPIYSVEKRKNRHLSVQQRYPITNEETFWSSLKDSQKKLTQSSVSQIENQTLFYEKYPKNTFSIHSIPKQSLLKLGGNKLLNQIVSSLTRSNGPGGIYPLSNNEEDLFSLIYHYQGGPRHWYIIPAYQREHLRKIIDEQNSSICLEHGQLLLDPSFLDKHHIRYHKLIQNPNEFLILSAGILSQSFTEDSSWSESILFALPSWIEQGYAFSSRSHSQCDLQRCSSSISIDFNLFKDEFVQKYLETLINHQSSSIDQEKKLFLNNGKTMRDLHPALIKHQQFSPLLIVSPPQNSFLNQDQQINSQGQMLIGRNNKFHNTTNENSFLTISAESNFDTDLFEFSQIYGEESSQTGTLMEISEMFDDIETINEQFSSFEELMDIIDPALPTTWSAYTQNEQLIEGVDEYEKKPLMYTPSISTDTITSNISIRNNLKKRKIDPIENRDKTLLVTGLRDDINQTDLYDHFPGCIQVTIKQCQTSSLKYAFILYRTTKEAKCNFLRSIDYILLGSECHVKYASYSSSLPIDHQSCDKQTVVVTGIPENVSEDDLRRLFPNCCISKYCPARTVQRMSISNEIHSKIKTFWGYAFLIYNNVQQAANVIEYAQQYQINGRPLCISFCSKKNRLESITK